MRHRRLIRHAQAESFVYGADQPRPAGNEARLGLNAVAAGSMANFMSACIAGMLL